MLNKLYKKAEHISDGMAANEQALLKLAKALNPDFPMAEGFKSQWIAAREEIFVKEEELANVLKEIKALEPIKYSYYE